MRQRLRILLVSDHGYLPDRTGGKEISTHELATWYARDGHDVSVLSHDHIPGYRPGSIAGAARYSRSWLLRRVSEQRLNYRVLRSPHVQRTMCQLIDQQGFDLAVLQFDEPHKSLDFDLPASSRYAVYIRDARAVDSMRADSFPEKVALAANSRYTAAAVARQTSRKVATIVPYVEKSRYETTPDGRFVTFVNPVSVKGVELALDIARACPKLPFLFVEGWPLSRRNARDLMRRLEDLPNIRFRRKVSDMRVVYRRTRVLLVPSQWEESWGRVVTESHFSAIPVLASRIGGLPESVGRGGILLPHSEPAKTWAEALSELYAPGLHDRISMQAREQADAYWATAQSLPAALLTTCIAQCGQES
jgi:glycosyltransferase involved in cell wall biosynthesis